VRVAAVPEVRPPAPDARPLTTEVRPPAPEARPAITEARTPAAAPDSRAGKKTGGKVLVFLGAKGGSGTTSIACNFSSALARESGKKTLLIDLHLPLGNVALELGVKPQYSIVDALRNAARLDSNFLSKLLSKHRSGLFVLASPDKFTPIQVSKDAIEKLLTTARQDFDYIVVDLGARLDLSELTGTAMLEDSATVYLITQDNVAELRNSNRLITEYFSDNGPKLEIVLNRYTPRISGIGMYSSHLVDEKHIGAALTKSPDWRIPQDSSDILLPVEGSSVARLFQNMARTVCEMEIIPESKKRTDGKEHSVSLFQ
jgi:pilus assembly protein CpaE